VFDDQDDLLAAHKRGELNRDFIAVVRFQGPRPTACRTALADAYAGVLQDKGFKVALVTDGRMSGASGKVPAAIHVTPEARPAASLAYIRTGDVIRSCAEAGTLEGQARGPRADGPPARRTPPAGHGYGRELFGWMRQAAGPADTGACRPVRGR
jgi:phosphogluconate dehydratase